MKKLRFLIPLLISIMVYVGINFIWGQNGIWALKQITQQKLELNNTIEKLESLNKELEMLRIEFSVDKEAIASYAKKIGFVAEGEKIVKISGIAKDLEPVLDCGSLYHITPIDFLPEWAIKVLSLVSFIITYAFIFLRQLSKKIEENKLFEKADDNQSWEIVYDNF